MGKTMKRKKEGIYQKNLFITRKKNADLSNKYTHARVPQANRTNKGKTTGFETRKDTLKTQ